jgi:hypothetical protein
MKRYIYMNHRIRQAKPNGPVIVVQDERGHQTEANGFDLHFDGFKIGRVVYDPAGLPACETHEVKAWVELVGNVEITPSADVTVGQTPLPFSGGLTGKPLVPASKVASAKRPNQPVKFK